MLETETIIQQCSEGDFKKVLPLFGEAYRFNPRLQEADYCEWQLKNTPFSQQKGYSLLVSKEGEQITGFLGYFPVEFRFLNEIHSGCISYNWYSTGKNRSGIKLLSELMVRYDKIFYLGCTSESEEIFKMFRMPMSRMTRWVGIIDSKKVTELFGMSKGFINPVAQHNGIKTVKRFDDNEEFSFDQWKSIKGYIRRTGRYLNWRYVDIPRHDYQIIRDDQGQFAVYRIEQIKNHEESVIRILEWNFLGKAGEGALAHIIEQARAYKVILIDFISTAMEIGGYLKSLGFFCAQSGQEGIPYLFRPIYYMKDILIAIDLPPHRVQKDFDFNQWYITKGDSDMDRIKL